MGKMKTRRAAAKRFKVSGSGKLLRRHSKMRHLLECKPPAKRRKLRQRGSVSSSDEARVRQMLPGGC